MKKLLNSKRRGSAIPLVMVAIMILLAMGVGLLDLGVKGRIYSIRTASDIAARCAADAGMTMALYEMNEKLKVKPWNDSTLPEATNESLPNCDAVFSYTITGYPGDHYLEHFIAKAGALRKEWMLHFGCNKIVCFYDNVVTRDDENNYFEMLEYLHKLLSWVEGKQGVDEAPLWLRFGKRHNVSRVSHETDRTDAPRGKQG